jgi:cold shock CspA family protein
VRLFPDEGYGFLTNEDGEEVYFHRNSVLEGVFDQLRAGSDVRFDAELGEAR